MSLAQLSLFADCFVAALLKAAFASQRMSISNTDVISTNFPLYGSIDCCYNRQKACLVLLGKKIKCKTLGAHRHRTSLPVREYHYA